MRKIVATAAVAALAAAPLLLTPGAANAARSAPSSGLSICATAAPIGAVVSGPPSFGQTSLYIPQNSCQTFPGASGEFNVSLAPDPGINNQFSGSDGTPCTGPNPGAANWGFCKLPFAFTEVTTGGSFGSTVQYAASSVNIVVAKNCGVVVDFIHQGNN